MRLMSNRWCNMKSISASRAVRQVNMWRLGCAESGPRSGRLVRLASHECINRSCYLRPSQSRPAPPSYFTLVPNAPILFVMASSSQRTATRSSGPAVQSSSVELLNAMRTRFGTHSKLGPRPEWTSGQMEEWVRALLKLAVSPLFSTYRVALVNISSSVVMTRSKSPILRSRSI
jgi:hypothetical protein